MSKKAIAHARPSESFWVRNKKSGGYLLKKTAGNKFYKFVRFLLLFGLCFMVIQPLLSKISVSFMIEEDLYDSTVISLPRHLTLVSTVTIGIPAFLLSLPPNHDRARPGFVKRVMRLGLPAGLAVAAVTFTTYEMVRPGGPFATATPTQASTATLAALIVAATWVLSVVARPYRWWKLALVGASLAAYSFIFATRATQELFLLDTSDLRAMTLGLISGAIGAVAVEATWWVRALAFKEPRRLWDAPQAAGTGG
jgi:hypothetical protein